MWHVNQSFFEYNISLYFKYTSYSLCYFKVFCFTIFNLDFDQIFIPFNAFLWQNINLNTAIWAKHSFVYELISILLWDHLYQLWYKIDYHDNWYASNSIAWVNNKLNTQKHSTCSCKQLTASIRPNWLTNWQFIWCHWEHWFGVLSFGLMLTHDLMFCLQFVPQESGKR